MVQPLDLDTILEATIFATRKHQGQIRKDQRGSPYVTHPLAAARAIRQTGDIKDPQILVAAILHDTLEDTDTQEIEIEKQFGKGVLSIVLEVTDDKSLEKMERKRRQVVHASHLTFAARVIKLADKLVNCRDILHSPPNGWSLKRRQDYVQWAADVVANIRGTNAPLEAAFDQMLADAEKALAFTIKAYASIDQRPWSPNQKNATR